MNRGEQHLLGQSFHNTGPLTLRQIEDLADTIGNLSPRQRRNLEQWCTNAKRRVETQQTERVTAAGNEMHERATRISEEMGDLRAEAEAIIDRLDAGRVTVPEARQRLFEIGHSHRALLKRVAQLEADQEATFELADQETADFEETYLEKTPALRRVLPSLSFADLNQP